MRFILGLLSLAYLMLTVCTTENNTNGSSSSQIPEFVMVKQLVEEFGEFLPQEAKEFIGGLSSEDEKLLEEYGLSSSSLGKLKARVDKLWLNEKVATAVIEAKIEALNPEAYAYMEVIQKQISDKALFNTSLDEVTEVRKQAIDQYKTLSDAAKASLNINFPKIALLAQSQLDEEIAEEMQEVFFDEAENQEDEETSKAVKEVLELFDKDNDQKISLEEAIGAELEEQAGDEEAKEENREHLLKDTAWFDEFDTDKSGKYEKVELEALLKYTPPV